MGQPSLVELLAKQQAGMLTDQEQAALNQKLSNLDVVASQQDAIGPSPTGNRTYGQYNFYIDWANDGAPTLIRNEVHNPSFEVNATDDWSLVNQQTVTNYCKNPSFEGPIQNTVNYCLNPSFEVNVTDDWTFIHGGGTGSVNLDATQYKVGAKSARIRAGTAYDFIKSTAGVSVPNNGTVTASCWIRCSADPTGAKAYLRVIRDDSAVSASTYATAASNGAWEYLSASYTNTSGGARIFNLDAINTFADGAADVWFDACQLELASGPSDYCDGSLGVGYAWDGTANNSVSRLTGCDWTFSQIGVGGSANLDATQFYAGTKSCRIRAGNAQTVVATATGVSVPNGSSVTCSGRVRCSASPAGGKAYFYLTDSIAQAIGAYATIAANGAWEYITATVANSSGGARTFTLIAVNQFNDSTADVWFDACQLELSASASPYCDGSLAGCVWDGTANNSTSHDNTVVNYCKNPSFEVNVTDDWTAVGVGSVNLDATQYKIGTKSNRVRAGATPCQSYTIAGVSVAAGAKVTISAWVRCSASPAGGKANIYVFDPGWAYAAVAAATVASNGAWEYLTCTATNGSGGALVFKLMLDNSFNDSAADVWFDACQLELGAGPSAYVDGSVTGCSWDGASNNSTSRGPSGSMTRDTAQHYLGVASNQILASRGLSGMFDTAGVTVANNAYVTAQARLRCSADPTTGSLARLSIVSEPSMVIKATSYATVASNGAWELVTVTWQNTTGAPIRVSAFSHVLVSVSFKMWVDCVQLELVSTASTYVDGTVAGAEWTGTAHNSATEKWSEWQFTSTYDDLSSRWVSADILRGMAGENAYCAIPAQIEVQLDNTDRYLSSDNLASPLGSYILGTAKKRCKLEIVSEGTAYQQFDGWVKEIAANPDTHGRRMATIVVDDLIGRMKSDPMISAMRTNVTETSLLALAAAGLFPSLYGSCYYGAAFYGGGGVYAGLQDLTPAFDAATDNFAYAGDTWRESETSNLDAVQDIMRSCLGMFYVDRTGTPTYKARTYRPLNATVSDWDASKVTRVDAVGLQDETLFNEVQLTIRQRKVGTPASVLWTLRDTPTVNAGATLTYVANFTDPTTGTPCGVINEVRPIQGTDYTNNAGINVAVSWRGADGLVQVYNSSGGPITLDLLQLRGTPITSLDKTLFKHTGSASLKKTKWHDAPLLSNSINAASYVDWLYSLMSLYTDKPRQITVTPVCAADLTQVAQLDVNRRILLLDGTIVYVNWVHHSIQSGSHVVTLGVSPAISSTMWILGTSQLGIDNALGI